MIGWTWECHHRTCETVIRVTWIPTSSPLFVGARLTNLTPVQRLRSTSIVPSLRSPLTACQEQGESKRKAPTELENGQIADQTLEVLDTPGLIGGQSTVMARYRPDAQQGKNQANEYPGSESPAKIDDQRASLGYATHLVHYLEIPSGREVVKEEIGERPVSGIVAKRQGFGVGYHASVTMAQLATEQEMTELAIDPDDFELDPTPRSDLLQA